MDFTSSRSGAVYFKIQVQYKRDYEDNIIETTGYHDLAHPCLNYCLAAKHEKSFRGKVLRGIHHTFTSTNFPSTTGYIRLCEAEFSDHVSGILMVLKEEDGPALGHHINGDKALSSTNNGTDQSRLDEYDRFALIFLSQEHAARYPPAPHLSMHTSPPVWLVGPITKLFEEHLLSRHPKEDRWSIGSADFAKWAPDGAEYEALTTLHQFCSSLRKIYKPGADFVIVSDGHVFSDCIGIDDKDVYKYTVAIEALSDDIYASLRTKEPGLPLRSPIRLVSLRDIFHPSGSDLLDRVPDVDLNDCEIYRPLNTRIDHEDENNRKMMMRSCAFQQGMLDKMIEDSPDGSLTATFRGFKKFMEIDLEACEDFKGVSLTQRRNIAEKVAKTMIYRNQAYSHLVELVFPTAVRLSIHQHNNHGPKFAVNLLPNNQFRKVDSLKPIALRGAATIDHAEDTKVDEAHIPTPWHNVLAEVEGDGIVYVCEAGVVKDELQDPYSPYDPEISGWVKETGRYALYYR